MSFLSIDMATVFMGFVKRQSSPISTVHTSLFVCKNRPKITAHTRKFLITSTTANSVKSRRVFSPKQPRKFFTRRISKSTPIIQTFYAEDDQIFNDVKLDGVVTVTVTVTVTLVDAKYSGLHLNEIKPK